MDKKWSERFESLLDWEREDGRLTKRKKNYVTIEFAPTARLIEVQRRRWMIVLDNEDGETIDVIHLHHNTLVNLGLAIVEAVSITEKVFTTGEK